MKEDKIKAWLLLMFLSLVWGSSYVLIKIGLESSDGSIRIPPMQLGALRMTIASVVLLPFAVFNRRKLNKQNILFILLSGLFGNGLPAFLYAYAETHLDSIITGMLNAMVPVFTILIASMVFGFKIKVQHVLGILIGLFGAFMIIANKIFEITFSKVDTAPILVVVFATVCYAISLNIIKYKLKDLKPITITSLSFFFVGIPSLAFLFGSTFFTQTIHHPEFSKAFLAVSTLSIVGTALAVLLFNHLIKISTPVFASSVTYFIPVVVILLGLLYGENVELLQILGVFVLILGVLVINKTKQQRK